MIFSVSENEDGFEVMLDKFKLNFPKNLYYSENDTWVKNTANAVTVGVTSFFQLLLGDAVFFEMPEINQEADTIEEVGSIESIKTVLDIFSPVSGKIVEINEKLENSPELVNQEPYGEGWLFKLEPNNRESEVKELLKAEEYVKLVEKKAQKETERQERMRGE